jgi:hypothetical protein
MTPPLLLPRSLFICLSLLHSEAQRQPLLHLLPHFLFILQTCIYLLPLYQALVLKVEDTAVNKTGVLPA